MQEGGAVPQILEIAGNLVHCDVITVDVYGPKDTVFMEFTTSFLYLEIEHRFCSYPSPLKASTTRNGAHHLKNNYDISWFGYEFLSPKDGS